MIFFSPLNGFTEKGKNCVVSIIRDTIPAIRSISILVGYILTVTSCSAPSAGGLEIRYVYIKTHLCDTLLLYYIILLSC